jgi:hypothetical protein
MNDKGKPYAQYTIFVRNSDWAAPMVQWIMTAIPLYELKI